MQNSQHDHGGLSMPRRVEANFVLASRQQSLLSYKAPFLVVEITRRIPALLWDDIRVGDWRDRFIVGYVTTLMPVISQRWFGGAQTAERQTIRHTRMNRYLVIAGVLLMGLVSSPTAVAEARDESLASTTVARWLAAFRAQEDAAEATLSDRPLVLEGVDMSTGPERRDCAELADKRPQAWPLRFTAADQPGLVSALQCLRRGEAAPIGDL